jgi:hypothetical protein
MQELLKAANDYYGLDGFPHANMVIGDRYDNVSKHWEEIMVNLDMNEPFIVGANKSFERYIEGAMRPLNTQTNLHWREVLWVRIHLNKWLRESKELRERMKGLMGLEACGILGWIPHDDIWAIQWWKGIHDDRPVDCYKRSQFEIYKLLSGRDIRVMRERITCEAEQWSRFSMCYSLSSEDVRLRMIRKIPTYSVRSLLDIVINKIGDTSIFMENGNVPEDIHNRKKAIAKEKKTNEKIRWMSLRNIVLQEIKES